MKSDVLPTQACQSCGRMVPVTPPDYDQVLIVTCRGGTTVRSHDFKYEKSYGW